MNSRLVWHLYMWWAQDSENVWKVKTSIHVTCNCPVHVVQWDELLRSCSIQENKNFSFLWQKKTLLNIGYWPNWAKEKDQTVQGRHASDNDALCYLIDFINDRLYFFSSTWVFKMQANNVRGLKFCSTGIWTFSSDLGSRKVYHIDAEHCLSCSPITKSFKHWWAQRCNQCTRGTRTFCSLFCFEVVLWYFWVCSA